MPNNELTGNNCRVSSVRDPEASYRTFDDEYR
jgi:hypothetical protein